MKVLYNWLTEFVKVTATPTGLTDGGPIALLGLKANLSQLPANNS